MAKTGPANNWYVITGAPSTGKSTVVQRLADLGYATLTETARLVINRELAAGKTLREVNLASPDFQARVIKLQLERESRLDKHDPTFLDRGILDTLGFHRHFGWTPSPYIRESCGRASYAKLVFFLELGDYEHDYARIETAETVRSLQKLSGKVYEELGYEIINIPRTSVEKRVDLILTTIKEKHHGLVT